MVSPTPGFSVAPITAIELGEKKGFVCKVLFEDINAYDPLIILRYPIDGSNVTVYGSYIFLYFFNIEKSHTKLILISYSNVSISHKV